MRVRYILDVKIPGEEYGKAFELHRELQGAVAEVLMDNGYTTDGLKAVRLDPTDQTAPGGRGHGKGTNL